MASNNVLFGMGVKGGPELAAALRKVERQFIDTMAAELPVEGAKLFGEAQALVPRLAGTLASSGSVESEREEWQAKTVVAYTDEKAAAVHEGIHHNRRVDGTRGFKWLERAYNASEGTILERIVARLRALTGGD